MPGGVSGRFTSRQPISSGATCSAGRAKKDWGRDWVSVVPMGVALGRCVEAFRRLKLPSNMGMSQSTEMSPVKKNGWLLLLLNANLIAGCSDAAISTTLPQKTGCKGVYVVKGVHEQEFYVGSQKAIADCFSDQRGGRDGGHSLTEFLSFPSGNPENNHILYSALKGSGIKDAHVFTLGL